MTRTLSLRILKGTVLALGISAASVSMAYTNYTTHYHISPNYDVTNLIANEQGDTWGGSEWATFAPGQQTTNVDLGWGWAGIHTPATSAIFIGLAQNLPNDADGQEHVVLLMDPTAFTYAQTDWGTLFTHTNEDSLIAAIHLYTSGQPFDVIQPGIDEVNTFLSGDAQNGILDGLAQPHSAWFTPGGTFDIVSFSNGTLIGTGTSEVTSEVFATPEPASMAALGIGVIALLRKRNRR